jgi:hypothetical protein
MQTAAMLGIGFNGARGRVQNTRTRHDEQVDRGDEAQDDRARVGAEAIA